MKQRLCKSTVLSSKRSRRNTRYSRKDIAKTFNKTECPYCGSDLAYFYWLKFDTAGYCPDCNVNWVETSNGTMWKLPVNHVGNNSQVIVPDCGVNLEEAMLN